MAAPRLQPLQSDTVRLLSCSQVISSIHSVVKELVENALDAKATIINIRLENYGLDIIEVKDNGTGVKKEDVPFIALPHSTSKISSFHDLCTLETYGFRGEALHSLAAMATLSVTTCALQGEVAHTYRFNGKGEVVSSSPIAMERGTTVMATHLFKDFPVRRQCYKSNKRCKEELKKIEEYLLGFGIGHPDVRFQLRHNKLTLWQKPVTHSLDANVETVLGVGVFQQMAPLNYQCFNPMVKLRAFVPKAGANVSGLNRPTPDRVLLLINRRPVVIKPLVQVVRQAFLKAFPCCGSRYPVAIVSISVLPQALDVNLEPNKTSVLLHDLDFICSTLESLLDQAYGPCKVAAGEEKTRAELEEITLSQWSRGVSCQGRMQPVQMCQPKTSSEPDMSSSAPGTPPSAPGTSPSAPATPLRSSPEPGTPPSVPGTPPSAPATPPRSSPETFPSAHGMLPSAPGMSSQGPRTAPGMSFSPFSSPVLGTSSSSPSSRVCETSPSSHDYGTSFPSSETASPPSSPHVQPAPLPPSASHVQPASSPPSSPHVQPAPPPPSSSHVRPVSPLSSLSHVQPAPPPPSSSHVRPVSPPPFSSHVWPAPPPLSSSHVRPAPPPLSSSHVRPAPPPLSSSHVRPAPPPLSSSHVRPAPPPLSSSHVRPAPPPPSSHPPHSSSHFQPVPVGPVQTHLPGVPISRLTSQQLKSKLTPKGPSPIFDMINSKPVKRKNPVVMSKDGRKKQKRSPAIESGSGEVQLCTADTSVQFDLSGVARRNSLMATCDSGQLAEGRMDQVIGWCGVERHGAWLVVQGSSIACFNVARARGETGCDVTGASISKAEVQKLLDRTNDKNEVLHHFHVIS